ncbi:MAG: SDR family oxidoreductase [Pseudomonadota bacterium]
MSDRDNSAKLDEPFVGDFTGQVAIVTGAGGGLGRAHALEFARRGARVVINDLGGSVDGSGGNSEAADKVVAEIRDMGGEAIANGASVSNREGVAGLIKQAIDAFGRIDILVNNAGVLRDKSFAKMSLDDFDFVCNVHLQGAAYCSHAVWPIMREQNYGRIIMTSSSSGIYGNFGQANYGAAKMAQAGLMNTLKLEGAKNNIRVNTLVPIAATRMTMALFPEEFHDAFAPEDVTPAVMFMASPSAPSGMIICAGAGHFAAARIEETPGVTLGKGATAEDLAAQWGEISDFSAATAFESGAPQTQKFAEAAIAKMKAGGQT